ncbi:MAG: sodium:solute symporter family protein [Tepidanaerobacteraceae bacterium]
MLWVWVAIYCAIMILFGFITKKWSSEASGYIVADRDQGTFVNAVGMAAILIAGTGASMFVSIGYSIGMTAHWWATGWAIAMLLGALFFGPLMRRIGCWTELEALGVMFDSKVRVVGAAAMSLGLTFSPLANILGSALMIKGLTGLPVEQGIIIMAVVTGIYVVLGGLWATLLTDLVQWILAILGFCVALPLWMYFTNGFDYFANLPKTAFNMGAEGFLPWISWTMPSVFGLFWMMFMLVIAGGYWHRAVAGRSEKSVTKAWLLSILLALPFGFLMPLGGMYLKARGIVLDNPTVALGTIFSYMPSSLSALGLVAVFAATMSTAEAGMVAGASIFSRDIYGRLINKTASEKDLVKVSRIVVIIYAILSVVGGIYFYHYTPVLGPALGLAALSSFGAIIAPILIGSFYWRWASKEGAFFGVLIGTIFSIVFLLFTDLWEIYHPQYVSFLVSGGVFSIINIIVRYTGPWWQSSLDLNEPENTSNGSRVLNAFTEIRLLARLMLLTSASWFAKYEDIQQKLNI